jgi:hypothetical protein
MCYSGNGTAADLTKVISVTGSRSRRRKNLKKRDLLTQCKLVRLWKVAWVQKSVWVSLLWKSHPRHHFLKKSFILNIIKYGKLAKFFGGIGLYSVI